ncbi:hypothetical protein [Sciscionella sediminilitoris]|uniref:hypothetical protein n=1 Tax=Sciscionella sediminilitoris TaxID=1445613 RepID=UPI0004DF6CC6|nr:hypothetical protein [Sciscionella sp. SE31]
MVDKYFNKAEFETMRQSIAKLKTEYEKVGDAPDARMQRLDHKAFGENEHSGTTGKAVTDHLGGVKESYGTARNRLHEVEQALDGIYQAHLEAEKVNKDNLTPKD